MKIKTEIVDRTKVKPFCNTLIEIKKDGVNVMFVSDGEKLIIQNNKPVMTLKVKPKDLSKYLKK